MEAVLNHAGGPSRMQEGSVRGPEVVGGKLSHVGDGGQGDAGVHVGDAGVKR